MVLVWKVIVVFVNLPKLNAFILYSYILLFYYLVEGIDINAATKYGIKVARIPGHVTGNAASCAEMAIYLMMGLLRKQVC